MKEQDYLPHKINTIDTYTKAYDLIDLSYLIIQRDFEILKTSKDLYLYFKQIDEEIIDNLSNYESFHLFLKKLNCFFKTGHRVKDHLWLTDENGNQVSFVAEAFWLNTESDLLIIT